jgi:tRNA nucleotidyltransferase (CCA-adding enzyme)
VSIRNGELAADRIPNDVLAVCARLHQSGQEAFLVGGAVRDLLLGRDTADYDVATAALPQEVMRIFGRRFAVPTGLQHGTVTVITESGRHVEVTTYRGEGAYSDGRRPDEVRFLQRIEDDLARRDFTVNALAYEPRTGTFVDPFGGRADLAARLIRAVGQPLDRLREDGLRAMRAVRLVAQLDFAIDAATRAAIPQALDVFRKVSAERVRDELLKLLAAPRPALGLQLMLETGLLSEVVPELLPARGLTQNRFHRYDVLEHTFRAVEATPSRDPVVRLGALLHDVGKPRAATPREDAPGEHSFFKHEIIGATMADDIAKRLRLSNRDRERVVNLVAQHMFYYQPEWSDGTVLRFLRRVGPENLDDLFALRAGDVAARGMGEDPEREIAELRTRAQAALAQQAALKVTDLAISGRDVMAVLACPPGPHVGQILALLLERVTDRPELNTPEGLRALVPEIAAELQRAR